MQTQKHTAFTARSTGLALVLTNEVQVSEAFDPTSTPTPPTIQSFQAIWDTGATCSVITRKVTNALQLKPSGRSRMRGVHGESDTDTYLINIWLPNKVGVIGVRAVEGQIGDHDVLLGMDIITLGDFAVTNHNGRTVWSFRIPSHEEIDFIPGCNSRNKMAQNSPSEQRRAKNRAKRNRKNKR